MKKIIWFIFISLFLWSFWNSFANTDEQDKIKWHLFRVESILRQVDTSDLNNTQKKNRLKTLDNLHKYATEWSFPNNDTIEWFAPFFRGSNWNLCAVWNLMYQDLEYKNYVDNIVQTNNNVRVMNIDNDMVFNNWLNKNGFTQLEAAMIQPTYWACWCLSEECLNKCPSHIKYKKEQYYRDILPIGWMVIWILLIAALIFYKIRIIVLKKIKK